MLAGGWLRRIALIFSLGWMTACSGSSSEDGPRRGGSSTGGERNATCAGADSEGEVQEPVFVANLPGQTGWFASPVVADLDGD